MRSMDFVRWHNPSQAFTTKHVSYPQLTATQSKAMVTWFFGPQYFLQPFLKSRGDGKIKNISRVKIITPLYPYTFYKILNFFLIFSKSKNVDKQDWYIWARFFHCHKNAIVKLAQVFLQIILSRETSENIAIQKR